MTLSTQEAREALASIGSVEERARLARTYRFSSPHVIMWGVIWVIGYLLNGLAPVSWINIGWLILIVIGFTGAALINRRTRSGISAGARTLIWLPITLFVISTYVLMKPTLKLQYEAFPPLCVALGYGIMGVFRAPVYGWLGAALFAMTAVGYFAFPGVFPFIMAGCGGALVAAGLWLGRN